MIRYQHRASGEIATEAWQYPPNGSGPPAPAWLAERGGISMMRPGWWATLDKFGLVDVWTPEEFVSKFTQIKEGPKP